MIMNAKDQIPIDLTDFKRQSFYDFVLNIHIFYDETSKVTSFFLLNKNKINNNPPGIFATMLL